nr:PREDICTED: ATP-dependent (S)-NAD(P)H-hydrate dehydratase [Bemisia tabaci]
MIKCHLDRCCAIFDRSVRRFGSSASSKWRSYNQPHNIAAVPYTNQNTYLNTQICLFYLSALLRTVFTQNIPSLCTANYSNMTSDYDKATEATCRQDSYKLLPILRKSSHKGEAGRVGIIGGSVEFSGAPYFSAISALRAGADLAYVFTVEKAAPVIKSYTPDLMVLPFLDKPPSLSLPFLARLHTLVIGPGLGRDEEVQKSVFSLLTELNRLKGTAGIPLIIDADGLHMILKNLDFIKNYSGKIYLTPNVNEFRLLYTFMKGSLPIGPEDSISFDHVELLTDKLGSHVTIIVKGPSDLIVKGDSYVQCTVEGGLGRCGGQGDILAGILGSTAHWAFINDFPEEDSHCAPEMLAGYIACMIVRKCVNKTFKVLGRSMETSDILCQLPSIFKDVYGSNW